MKVTLLMVNEQLRFAYKNPGKVVIRAGQGLFALACAYVAVTHLRSINRIPVNISATNELVDFGSKLVASTGMMIASYVAFKAKLYSVPDANLSPEEAYKKKMAAFNNDASAAPRIDSNKLEPAKVDAPQPVPAAT